MSIEDIKGNGLDQLIYLTDSKTVTRGFKNRLKSIGIFRPAYVDHARLVWKKTKVVRYDRNMSNNAFRYLWVKRYGTPEGLKYVPKQSYSVISHYVDERNGRIRLPMKHHPGAIHLTYREMTRRDKPRHNRFAKIDTPLGEVLAPPRAIPRVDLANMRMLDKLRNLGYTYDAAKTLLESRKTGPKAGHILSDGELLFKTYLGGVSKQVPLEHHKKYWYFLRKKGFFRFSEHHPYGDEHTYFKGMNLR
jgi:hypothetical protein